MPPKRKAPADTAASSKRFRSVIDESVDDLMCPITQALPLDPVMAEDGKVYEKAAIESWLKQHARSPSTNLPMGARLVAATQVKNLIERMVRSEALPEEKVTEWKERLRQQDDVEEIRRAAEGGDAAAAYQMGVWYKAGSMGLAIDLAKAVSYFKKAAEAGHAAGAGRLSSSYYWGWGVARNYMQALRGAAAAAALGNGNGMVVLSHFYLDGTGGMPVDKEEGFKLKAKAADLGCLNSRGLYHLGIMHEKGEGTAVDMGKAAEAMRKAIESPPNPASYVEKAQAWLTARGLDA